MERIGKYQGKVCYKLTKKEFFDGKYYENDKDVFVIHEDGLMIFKNRAFARYDGNSVDEFRPHDYYVPNEARATAEAQAPIPSTTPGEFSEYSKCVDDFFANLKEVSL